MIQLKKADYILKDADGKGTVVFVANSFGVQDIQGDVSLKGSFAKTLNESFPRLKYLYNHDHEKVIGVPIEAHENDIGLIVKAALNLEKPLGKDTYLDYKMSLEYGRSVEHSCAVICTKSTGTNPRYVSEWKLAEVSYVPLMGANSETPLLELKSAEKAFIEHCYNNGDYSPCRMKTFESLLDKPDIPLDTADDNIINFFNNLKF